MYYPISRNKFLRLGGFAQISGVSLEVAIFFEARVFTSPNASSDHQIGWRGSQWSAPTNKHLVRSGYASDREWHETTKLNHHLNGCNIPREPKQSSLEPRRWCLLGKPCCCHCTTQSLVKIWLIGFKPFMKHFC